MTAQDIQPVAITDNFEQWRQKTNLILESLQATEQVAEDANALDSNFAVDTVNGLSITVKGGLVRQDAAVNIVSPDTFVLGANNTYGIYLTLNPGSEALAVALIGAVPSAGVILLHRVTTDATTITTVLDKRTFAIGQLSSLESIALPIEELQTATIGQTDFTLLTVTTNDGIAVYVDGVRQTQGADYTAIGVDEIQFNTPLFGGERVLFVARDLTGNLKFIAKEDRQTGTDGQTVINVPSDLQPADESIALYLDGIRQPREVLTFDEDLNTITLSEALSGTVDILLVRGDVAGTTAARTLPPGGTEGKIATKQSAVDFDVDYQEMRSVNKIFNGGMLLGDEEADAFLTTSYAEYAIDNMYAAVPAGIGSRTYQIRQDKVGRDESRSLFATVVQIGGSGTINPIIFRARVYGKEAASIVDANTVFQCRVSHDTGADIGVGIRYLKLDGTIRDNFDSGSATYTQVAAPVTTIVPTGTPTDVVFKTSPVTTDVSAGMLVEVTITATAAGTVKLSQFDLREGTIAFPFEPNYSLDMAMSSSLKNVGKVEMFSGAEIPRGGLFGDGSQYLISRFPRLNNYYDGAYNDGSESVGYFRVPDYRGVFPRFYDDRLVSNTDPNALDVSFTGTISGALITGVSSVNAAKLCENMLVSITAGTPTIPANTRVVRVSRTYGTSTYTIELSASATGSGAVTVLGIGRIRADGTTSSTNGGVPVVGSIELDVAKEHSHKELIGASAGADTYTSNTLLTSTSVDQTSTMADFEVSGSGGKETRPINVFLVPVICTGLG